MTNNYIADQNGFRSSLAPSNGPLLPLVGKAPKVSVSHAPVASKPTITYLCAFFYFNGSICSRCCTSSCSPCSCCIRPSSCSPRTCRSHSDSKGWVTSFSVNAKQYCNVSWHFPFSYFFNSWATNGSEVCRWPCCPNTSTSNQSIRLRLSRLHVPLPGLRFALRFPLRTQRGTSGTLLVEDFIKTVSHQDYHRILPAIAILCSLVVYPENKSFHSDNIGHSYSK